MFKVLGLTKIAKTDPQLYELRLYDSSQEGQPGYAGTTECGTEDQMRVVLETLRMPKSDIDYLIITAGFRKAG